MREPIQTFYDTFLSDQTCTSDLKWSQIRQQRRTYSKENSIMYGCMAVKKPHTHPTTRGKTGEGVGTATSRLRFLSARNLYCITISFPTFSLVNRKLPSFISIFAAGCKRHEYFLPIVQNVALCSLCKEPNFTR